jgi:GGDEF domain-containing protein
LSVVFVDLDRFKGSTKPWARGRRFGAHNHGEIDCIGGAGHRLRRALRRHEFVIVLPGLASPGAEIFCERLIARLRSTLHTIRRTTVTVTASVGLATHAPKTPFQRASHLINAADRSGAHRQEIRPLTADNK